MIWADSLRACAHAYLHGSCSGAVPGPLRSTETGYLKALDGTFHTPNTTSDSQDQYDPSISAPSIYLT